MKRLILALVLLVPFVYISAQPSIDSLKQKLGRATTPKDKVDLLSKISRALMGTNPAESEKYAAQMNREAELSRDRSLMVKALLVNGERNSYLSFRKENVTKSIDYYNRALDLARKSELDADVAKAYLGLSGIHVKIPELDKALNYTTQAFSVISSLKSKNDTLSVSAYNSFGGIYQARKERILALRNYLAALRIAEVGKHSALLRSCFSNLSKFYADIKEYDKAIDYAQRSMEQLPLYKPENERIQKTIDLYSIGQLYMLKKDFEMSEYYYEQSIRMADSLKYNQLKMPAYEGLLQQYVTSDQPGKALHFLNTRQEFRDYTKNFGTGYMIDGSYGIIYSQMGRLDSARYYFEKAAPEYERLGTLIYKIGFYYQYANFHKRAGNYAEAARYLNMAFSLADQSGNLEFQSMIAKEMDTVQYKVGNFMEAHRFNSLYHQYNDSLKKLGEEKDLLQMELADEQQRAERLQKEEEAALREKHNLQYMGITIAIAVVFLLLILLGIFQVSETTIRIMGFFAFIFLFEFIILLADNKIHHWTHGEPLPILGIKIILIAILLPLHHWLEHRVVKYLASKRLIIPRGKGIWNQIRRKETAGRP